MIKRKTFRYRIEEMLRSLVAPPERAWRIKICKIACWKVFRFQYIVYFLNHLLGGSQAFHCERVPVVNDSAAFELLSFNEWHSY